MKTKLFATFVLALIFVLGFAAAALTLTPSTLTFDKNDTSKTFTIANSGPNTTNITLTSQTITDTNGKTVTIGFNSTTLNITAGSSASVSANVTSQETGFLLGEFSKTYTINDTNNTGATSNLVLKFINSFCSAGSINENDLSLRVKINNLGNGEDNEWLPLDTIEVEIELRNNGADKLSSVIFEIGLFKKGSTTNVAGDMIWLSKDDEKVDVGSISSDKKDSHVFEFRVDPAEVDDGDYILVAKAFPDGKQTQTCIDFSDNFAESDFGSSSKYTAEISIVTENDVSKMVVVDEESYPNPITAFCGETVSFSPKIYNIGDEDFLDQVKVLLTNNELGLNLEDIILGDLDQGDSASASFVFQVPTNAVEKQYNLLMDIFYDYDEDDGTYDESSDDTFAAYLKVQGNCVSSSSKASVSAELQSGGKAGEELIVKATIRNTGNKSATYNVNVAGYSTWASSAKVDPQTITIDAGQSRDVLVTLNVKDGVSGTQAFNIELTSNGQFVLTQPLSASIEPAKGLFGMTGFAIGNGNWYVWVLGALNVVLVIIIIIVAIRLMRR